MNETEQQLIQRLKNREEESFAVLFHLYGGQLYQLAYKMCRNTHDAQDAVQLTFVQAMKSIDGFKGNSRLSTWLYTIARNECLKLIGKENRSRVTSLEALIKNASQPFDQSVCSTFEKQSYIDQVKEGCLLGLLHCLPFHQRMAFILNVLLDVNARDVGLILGKSETAVRLLVLRARRSVKSYLCKNCSLYNPGAPCRCENLIGFSLKQGWIERSENTLIRNNHITAADIEKEISQLQKIKLLYGSMGERQLNTDTLSRIKKEMNESDDIIFSSGKVK